MSVTIAEALLKRDRIVVGAALASVISLAWAYMFYLGWQMKVMVSGESGMDMAMSHVQVWGVADFFFTFIMWAVMMVAMMTPSAAPMVLVFSKLNRQRHPQQTSVLAAGLPTGIFLSGYLIVWASFSAVATATQWGLHSIALLSPMMESTSPVLGGALLIGAGVFQFTSLKQTCLAHCRSPLGFLMSEWRQGCLGALRMGMHHGAYCVGCCWLLMALLFVAGVMNLLWVATIAAYVLIEKVAPDARWLSRATGFLIIAWGTWLIAGI